MTDYKTLLGSLAIFIGLVRFVPYFRGILIGKTKPHAFSWLVWAILAAIIFAAQLVSGAGIGAGISGVTALACFVVFLLALFKGSRKFPFFDWVALAIAAFALVLWKVTKDPTLSVVLITATDAIGGSAPTFRKGYFHPHEETISMYALGGVSYTLALLALENFTLATWLNPAVVAILDSSLAIMLLIRRKQLAKV